MGYVVKMPKLGLEMDQGTILTWYIEEGDPVEEDEPVAEVESEKSVANIDAREGGILRVVEVEESATVSPGTPIAIIAGENEDIAGLEAEFDTEESTEPMESEADENDATEHSPASDDGLVEKVSNGNQDTKASSRAERRAEELSVDLATVAGSGPQGVTAADGIQSADGEQTATEQVRASPRAKKRADELDVDLAEVDGSGPKGAITADDVEALSESETTTGRTFAAPRVRQLAREHGIDIETIDGSGTNRRITESDVQLAVDKSTATPSNDGASEASAGVQTRPAERTLREENAFDGMRRTIAGRLSQSYQNAVHVTEHREVDVEAFLDAVETAEDVFETEISMPDLLLLALSASLSDYPGFNATFEDDMHRLYEEHNVSIAVDVDAGLITPVIPSVNDKAVNEIAIQRRELTEKALSGEYTMNDLQGGTFTVTNLGVLGVESFDPIINPPQVAILGVNAIQQRPTPEGDKVAFKKHLPLDLSFDHRVVDGADAARFLETLTNYIENPMALLFKSA